MEKLNQHLHKMQREGDVPLAASFLPAEHKNCVIFHTVGCCESKNVPPTQLPNLGSALPGLLAQPGCARVPVAIKSQVSSYSNKIPWKMQEWISLLWLCFQKLYYSFCVHILFQLRNVGLKLSTSLYLSLAVGQTLSAWCFLKAKFSLLLNKLPVKHFFLYDECRLWLIIFKGQMENKSGRSIYFDVGTNCFSLLLGPPTSGFGHTGLNCLQYSRNFGMAADAYLNNSVFTLWGKIHVKLQPFRYRDNWNRCPTRMSQMQLAAVAVPVAIQDLFPTSPPPELASSIIKFGKFTQVCFVSFLFIEWFIKSFYFFLFFVLSSVWPLAHWFVPL